MRRAVPRAQRRTGVPRNALAQGGEVAKRAFDAMMTMQKNDVAAIEAAVRGVR